MLNANLSYTTEYLPPIQPVDPREDQEDHRRAASMVRSARELRRREFPPVRYVVPGYVVEGCTLLAGRPKLGKSWLVLDMCLAVAMSADCLGGIACEQGDVLYLALEDNERRLQTRIDKVLGAFAEDWPERFQYATEWLRANAGGLEAVEEWIVSTSNPRLIVVDVLAMFRPASGNRDNLYEADYRATHVTDDDGRVFITPECFSFDELEGYINALQDDLDQLRERARRAFQKDL